MKFSKLAVSAAVLIGSSVAVNAAVTDLGAVSPTVPKTFFGIVSSQGTFNDLFSFTLPTNSGSGYSVVNVPIPGYGSIFSYAALYSNPDGVLTGFNGDEGSPLQISLSTAANTLSFSYGPSSAGSYWLAVSGIASGSAGAAYAGSISVTAVPEPETYAMLLAGLGLMGAIARRRNKA
jgi:PEP-CTERM motif